LRWSVDVMFHCHQPRLLNLTDLKTYKCENVLALFLCQRFATIVWALHHNCTLLHSEFTLKMTLVSRLVTLRNQFRIRAMFILLRNHRELCCNSHV